MAGIGDMLASMVAGGAEQYATNRGTEIRDEERSALAAAREEKMMALQSRYRIAEQGEQNKFTSGESEKERGFKSSESEKDRAAQRDISAANNATQIQSANISAAASKARASSEGGAKNSVAKVEANYDPETNEKDGTYTVFYRDGTANVVTKSQLPGGDVQTPKQKMEARRDANAQAATMIKSAAGTFRSDEEDFGAFGGDRKKAQKAVADAILAAGGDSEAVDLDSILKGGGQTSEAPPATKQAADRGAKAAEVAEQDNAPALNSEQRALVDRVRQKYPDASEADIVMSLKQNPKTASKFK